MFGSRLEIHVIHTDAGSADHFQLFRVLHQLAIHDCAASNDDAVHIPGDFAQLISSDFVVNDGLDRLGAPDNVYPGGIESEIPPVVRLNLKVETNTREHFPVHGTTQEAVHRGVPVVERCRRRYDSPD